MDSFFVLCWIISFISIAFWCIQLIKYNEIEKNKKGIKAKFKKLFNPRKFKEETKPLKYTGQQIKIFLVSSFIAFIISFIGIGLHSPPTEVQNITNNDVITEITDNKEETQIEQTNTTTTTTEDSAEEENTSLNELESDSKEQNTSTNESTSNSKNEVPKTDTESQKTISVSSIPAYSGKPYVTINNNVPYFSESDLTTTSYEYYSNLDSLGRCGVAIANIGKDIMPTADRGDIGSVKPTGWHTVKYDIVSGKYLYNRCHLIGYQLSGENANTKNLITGTRYLNIEGMLPFENMVDDYIEETNNHVLYRVTPIFEGNNLLASGVLMEAKSVEDNGAGILFNVYCYNVQPGITINYSTGESSLSNSTTKQETTTTTSSTTTTEQLKEETQTEQTNTNSQTYILNKNTKKFHYTSCGSASKISEKNKGTYSGSRDDLISQGYSPCGNCDP